MLIYSPTLRTTTVLFRVNAQGTVQARGQRWALPWR